MVLNVGFFVKVNDQFYQITGKEPFEYRTGEEASAFFSSVASGSESGYKSITEIEPDEFPLRLMYITPGIRDGMRYYVKIPVGSARFGTDVTKDIGFIDNEISPYHAPNENFGFWLIHNYYPSINAKNNTGLAMTPKVYFKGYKFDIVQVNNSDTKVALQSGRIPFANIIIGGVKN